MVHTFLSVRRLHYMGQVLHGSATTTAAVRRAIQHSQESMRAFARRHGINPKTVAKWKRRESTADRRTGPTDPRSTVLRLSRRPLSSRFANTRCCRSTTACMHFWPRSSAHPLYTSSVSGAPWHRFSQVCAMVGRKRSSVNGLQRSFVSFSSMDRIWAMRFARVSVFLAV
jgi:hypothetical protein